MLQPPSADSESVVLVRVSDPYGRPVARALARAVSGRRRAPSEPADYREFHVAGGRFAVPASGWDLAGTSPLPLLLAGFAALLLANAPVFVALGLPAVGYLVLFGGSNPIMFPQIMLAGTDNFVLLAVPLFVLAGALMETGGISTRLVSFAMAVVGHVRGGLAQVAVVGEILFSGISGSTVADVAAMSGVLLPAMRRAGYSKADAVSIVSAASAMGILVPPSLLMVILGAMADLSVTRLFLAGFLPSFVLAGALMLLVYVQARRKGWPTARRASLAGLGRSLAGALIPLTMPVIIFGSIFTGAAMTLHDLEMQYILRVLEQNNGNKPETAKQLGISLKTLYNKLNAMNDTANLAG